MGQPVTGSRFTGNLLNNSQTNEKTHAEKESRFAAAKSNDFHPEKSTVAKESRAIAPH
jgi:hypothetical protein